MKPKIQQTEEGVKMSIGALISKGMTRDSDWPDKDQLLDILYWARQILAAIVGILWASIPFHGLLGLLLYVAFSTVVGHVYVTMYQRVDEETVGGFWEIAKEGFGSAFATFMVCWIAAIAGDGLIMSWFYCFICFFTFHWPSSISLEHNVLNQRVVFLILSQPNSEYDEQKAFELKADLLKQSNELGQTEIPTVFISHQSFNELVGAWAVWPVFKTLTSKLEQQALATRAYWLFVCESDTIIRLERLLNLLSSYDPNEAHFLGHSLVDRSPTVIHHYASPDPGKPDFKYPDFSAGIAITGVLIKKLAKYISAAKKFSDFIIDAKHELAQMIEVEGAVLTDIDTFCTTRFGPDCVTEYRPTLEQCSHNVTDHDVLFGVKTYSAYHKTRVVVVKRTWARDARHIEFYSDRKDMYIPTVVFEGVDNTKRGHCAKTFAIIRRFVEDRKFADLKWLVITDDDSLVSVDRLFTLLNCYDPSQMVILGERYGYGFGPDGIAGYDYPTGGSGMVFSRPAANTLRSVCACPTNDSPDDMIIGMCAKRSDINIFHWQGLHQARPDDYSLDYLIKIPSISFHKHWEVDPYMVYKVWLQTNDNTSDKEKTDDNDDDDKHTEL